MKKNSTNKHSSSTLEKIKYEIKDITNPSHIHIITFFTSLVVLSILLNSQSILLYILIQSITLVFFHFLHIHKHKPYDIVRVFGMFFVPIILTLVIKPDWFSLFLFGIYVFSLVSMIGIYHYHGKKHHPIQIMWQITYSKVIAITAMIASLTLLPYMILNNQFMSIYELTLVYIFPAVLVFFFISKFFYTYYFDHKHIRLDILKSLRHTLIFSIGFVLIIFSVYSLFATGMYNDRMSKYDEYLNNDLIEIQTLQNSIENYEYETVKDLNKFLEEQKSEINNEKNQIEKYYISMSSILDDEYFVQLAKYSVINAKRIILLDQALNVRSKIGDVIDSNETKINLKQNISEMEFESDSYLKEIQEKINNPDTTVSYYEKSGLFFLFSDLTDTKYIYSNDNIFLSSLTNTLRHTIIYRELSLTMLKTMIFSSLEEQNPSINKFFIDGLQKDNNNSSITMRYEILKSSATNN